jgi:branched-chain amino acid transport system ATP-binding protein
LRTEKEACMPEEVILESTGITKRFGDFTAVDRVNYRLEKGEAAGIIGPNGAGKSTFFNLLTGLFPPTKGTISYRGLDITAKGAHRRVALGLIRTFQLVSVFDSLSVLDNMLMPILQSNPECKRRLRFLLGNRYPESIACSCTKSLERMGLSEKANLLTAELSYGDKRKLEIAMALSLNPVVLLLDEPFAGLSEVEITEMVSLIEKIKSGLTLVIIEHKISRILGIIDRLSVMHEGRIIADGAPDAVLCDENVRRVYWGESTCTIQSMPGGVPDASFSR